MELVVMGILSTAALIFVAYPLINPNRHLYFLEDMLGLGDQKKLNYLYSQRALVYENIKDLEMEHDMGKLSEADFKRLREGLMLEAQAIVKAIDDAKVKREIDDLIEKDVSTHRKIKE